MLRTGISPCFMRALVDLLRFAAAIALDPQEPGREGVERLPEGILAGPQWACAVTARQWRCETAMVIRTAHGPISRARAMSASRRLPQDRLAAARLPAGAAAPV